jgi:hypothetical protein
MKKDFFFLLSAQIKGRLTVRLYGNRLWTASVLKPGRAAKVIGGVT